MSDYATTPNYGLFKPVPNADNDLWGDHWNSNADTLDTVIKGIDTKVSSGGVTSFNTRTGAVALSLGDVLGALTYTPYNNTNPAGYQTAANVTTTLAPYALTTSLPVASSTLPSMDATAAIGTGTTWARADHIHPVDTSRYAATNPAGYQTAANVTTALAAGSPGAFSTLSASGAVSGAGFTTLLAPYAPLASPTFTGTVTAGGGRLICSSASSPNIASIIPGVYGAVFRAFSTGAVIGQCDGAGTAVGANWLAMDDTNSFFSSKWAVAFKPGGGTWTDSSDVRLKQNVEDYRAGLAEICKLRPVTYEYNGLAGTLTGKRYHGLIAQEVAAVMPEMVGSRRGRLNRRDHDETDILTVDATPAIYALMNAVRELTARVEALEARS